MLTDKGWSVGCVETVRSESGNVGVDAIAFDVAGRDGDRDNFFFALSALDKERDSLLRFTGVSGVASFSVTCLDKDSILRFAGVAGV